MESSFTYSTTLEIPRRGLNQFLRCYFRTSWLEMYSSVQRPFCNHSTPRLWSINNMEAFQIFSDNSLICSITYCILYMATLILGLGTILPLIVFLWSLSLWIAHWWIGKRTQMRYQEEFEIFAPAAWKIFPENLFFTHWNSQIKFWILIYIYITDPLMSVLLSKGYRLRDR